jgi:aminopeptidase N
MLGEMDFVRGVALYAQRQDGRAATIEDLLSAMEEVSGSPLEQFKLWYSAVGTPVVEMHQDHDEADRTLDIRFRQSRPSDPDAAARLHMPLRLALLSPQGNVRDLGVMELRTRDASLRVEGVEPGSVISANRGFSAPIILKADYSAADLVKLVLHEPDAVARWDAMQSLMCMAVLETMSGKADMPTASSGLVDAVGQMLAQADTPPGVKAELLTFVHIGLVSDHLEEIDVDQIAGAIELLRRKIAVSHREVLLSLFERCSEAGEFSRTADARGRRKLRAVCLEYLLELEEEACEALALAEIRSAAGMTAKSAALYAICDHQGPLRGEAVASFLDQYGHVPEALRIWFRAQALSRQPGTADIVRQLADHPAFDISKTPLSMALFGGFFRQNRAGFHEKSGAGYRLWGEIILATDRLRPQGTKWLMPQMMNWRRFDRGRREMMKSQLEFVAAQAGISPTLAENVRQALENGGSADR